MPALIEETEKQFEHAAIMLAGLCRLQHLQMKIRNPVDGVWTPTTPEEGAEYHRLNQWWLGIGEQKRHTVLSIAIGLAQNINPGG